MADLTDPVFWQRQLDTFIAAPVPSGILLVLGPLGAWWLRGQTKAGEIAGLNAQMEPLNERLRLAT